MATFSQRHGYTSLEASFQREHVDEALRTRLWNVLKIFVWDTFEGIDPYDGERMNKWNQMFRRLWINYFNRDLDQMPAYETRQSRHPGFHRQIKQFFFECEWYAVYDFLEVIATDRSGIISSACISAINSALEKHNAAYRFVEKSVVEMTNELEIKSIEDGLQDAEAPARIHLKAALRMLSDRQAPDYRNSVKEAISAVESTCRLVSGNPSASLGDALKKVKAIHPALQKAFSQLYGYTSDASGVRHALTDESAITYADAKFMLATCSAFVSYLKLSTVAQ